MAHHDPNRYSLQSILYNLGLLSSGDLSNDENFNEALKGLLLWPPDVFLVTSTILQKTGVYRFVAGPDGSRFGENLWGRFNWESVVEREGQIWRQAVENVILNPDTRLEDAIKEISGHPRFNPANTSTKSMIFENVDRLSSLGTQIKLYKFDIIDLSNMLSGDKLSNVNIDECIEFFEIIVSLHAFSDEACSSIGLPNISRRHSGVFMLIANLMLTFKGSISVFNNSHGIILPKLRTPQKGLTLRNMSHHLTYHSSEVDVVWRSCPARSSNDKMFNILAVPHPKNINKSQFEIHSESYESVGYFSYTPEPTNVSKRIVDLIIEIEKKGTKVHAVVLPETALLMDDYMGLLEELSQRVMSGGGSRLPYVPIVISGVSSKKPATGMEKGGDSGYVHINELRLAVYFAGRWYETRQNKHHRWQLNEQQVCQYGLQDVLPVDRGLFESMSVTKRRLTFFTPTPWLTIAPLICEDLAQLEPVSDLMRGVGPTLVLALLLDGPQIIGRWPARYASVLAEDPGSSVMTLTAEGMVKLSRSANVQPDKIMHDVVSWRDKSGPHFSYSLNPQPFDTEKEIFDALLLSLSAEFSTEYTLDHRSDRGLACSFKFKGVIPHRFPKTHDHTHPRTSADPDVGGASDIRDLTAGTFLISTILDLLRKNTKYIVKTIESEDDWKFGNSQIKASKNWESTKKTVMWTIDMLKGGVISYDNDGKIRSGTIEDIRKQNWCEMMNDENNVYRFRILDRLMESYKNPQFLDFDNQDNGSENISDTHLFWLHAVNTIFNDIFETFESRLINLWKMESDLYTNNEFVSDFLIKIDKIKSVDIYRVIVEYIEEKVGRTALLNRFSEECGETFLPYASRREHKRLVKLAAMMILTSIRQRLNYDDIRPYASSIARREARRLDRSRAEMIRLMAQVDSLLRGLKALGGDI